MSVSLKDQLIRSIKRSEKAYSFYLEDKFYFQALRIYKANKIVYHFLEEFIYECEENDLDQIFLFLFHLEDWFESFEATQKTNPALTEPFVFERLTGSPAFPREFIKNVLNT